MHPSAFASRRTALLDEDKVDDKGKTEYALNIIYFCFNFCFFNHANPGNVWQSEITPKIFIPAGYNNKTWYTN